VGLHWPGSVGERLHLSWTGEADSEAVFCAAGEAYFELTGVRAVAGAEGIAPVLYRRRGTAPRMLGESVELSVELTAIGRRCASMQIAWRVAEDSGVVHWIWCWRTHAGASAPIPAAAKIGVFALDGARLGLPVTVRTGGRG